MLLSKYFVLTFKIGNVLFVVIINYILFIRALMNEDILKDLDDLEDDIISQKEQQHLSEQEQEGVEGNGIDSSLYEIAPNLCQLLGAGIASKIIKAAGGVKQLAAIPACNIQVLGGQRSDKLGLFQTVRNHTGVFAQMDIVKDAPRDYQMQLVRMLASNTAKCARADALKSSKGLGARFRDEIMDRFDKVQEKGGLHRIDKPLEIPDLQPKKKRGGKRFRKTKELYEMSDIRKQQNRLKFGEEAEQQLDDGVGLGMLTQGTGRLKLQIKKQKVNVSKKMAQRMNKKTGFESVVNIDAPSGMELVNPDSSARQSGGSQTIFSKAAGFQTVLNNKFGSYK